MTPIPPARSLDSRQVVEATVTKKGRKELDRLDRAFQRAQLLYEATGNGSQTSRRSGSGPVGCSTRTFTPGASSISGRLAHVAQAASTGTKGEQRSPRFR